eukprot:TRINITY_DN1147_c0_g1_i3.p3 TRINITY_DN1147_c0_g1~~TRINITY_DN1147_c0_g1_i3.p3  ORF type:complete len:194 (-),score=4.59 TRINITY_DN1147_c0_g1_i3:485-1066(-)
MQLVARRYAHMYNLRDPPKLVGFLQPALLRLHPPPGLTDASVRANLPHSEKQWLQALHDVCTSRHRDSDWLFAIEPCLVGHYQKYNSNFGWTSTDDRNTPAAFSHFTYCLSGGHELVCDIQGVGDFYTDPQIHAKDQRKYGRGNLGEHGMVQFFRTHRCNAVCHYLRLHPSRHRKAIDHGTAMRPREEPPESN